MVKKRKSSNQCEKDREDNRKRMSTFVQKNIKPVEISDIEPVEIRKRVDDVHQMLGLATGQALIDASHPLHREYPNPVGGGRLRFFPMEEMARQLRNQRLDRRLLSFWTLLVSALLDHSFWCLQQH